ncbi:flagellin [Heliorestis acidaminivorans]|uniref:Flagellin n=1 Tax=Heliorestis acidaminivorans TaxID=553427 RepID=A0A6I0F6C4_9FIRM|nr:flagellin [Heliorestis acidaminivorans]KAB2952922.1 flagellin [Heliorestis acidaminivorans]
MAIGGISNNVTSSYYKSLQSMGNSQERLSSALQINRAGDNPAGLAIAEKISGQVRGLNQASSNIQDGISMLRTSEGAMDSSHSIMQRMRELSIQASNGTLSDSDRSNIQNEINQLKDQLNTNANQTQFNTIPTNDGTLQNSQIQAGANSGQTIDITISDTSVAGLGANIDVSTQANASSAIADMDQAIRNLSSTRSDVGALENRLEQAQQNSQNAAYQQQASESRIRDADMAKEIMLFKQSGITLYSAIMTMATKSKTMGSNLSLLV